MYYHKVLNCVKARTLNKKIEQKSEALEMWIYRIMGHIPLSEKKTKATETGKKSY